MVQLPNTEIHNCEHPSHGDEPARAVTQIRFALGGEIVERWGCLEHRSATDFGYVPPKGVEETLAGAAKPKAEETASEDRPSEAIADESDEEPHLDPGEEDRHYHVPSEPEEPPNQSVGELDTSGADDEGF